ncbi:hypothetical protein BWI97_12750 [Siphonobacter sp. BAB-5405]|nr:hypothetical protein BWI97_12750 [Siphonobacter sp. BAB-5405]
MKCDDYELNFLLVSKEVRRFETVYPVETNPTRFVVRELQVDEEEASHQNLSGLTGRQLAISGYKLRHFSFIRRTSI